MIEAPILFSGPMIQALRHRKTQTRRLAWTKRRDRVIEVPSVWQNRFRRWDAGYRYRFWVQETWKPHSIYAHLKPSQVPDTKLFYRADETYAPSNTPWVAGLYMPRWGSRFTLVDTRFHLEHLLSISNDDAEAEGVEWETADPPFYYVPGIWPHSLTACEIDEGARTCFFKLWDHLHGAGAREKNPEVVVLSFRVVEQNIDKLESAA